MSDFRLVLVGLVAAGACSFNGSVPFGASSVDGDATTADFDGRGDGDGGIAICETWNPQHFVACSLPTPIDALILTTLLSPWHYDTDTGILTDTSGTPTTPPNAELDQGNGVMARILSTNTFQVEGGAELRVDGSMGLIVAAFGDIDIAGTIDGASTRGGKVGPGADPSLCTSFQALPGGNGNSGSGGGGGGGFQGNGSQGGDADSNGSGILPGGAAGTAVGTVPALVRGGCSGSESGTDLDSSTGAGGSGGGAIQLSAFGSITLSGVIHMGGAGGLAGPNSTACGGGGGGSGGYIGLEGAIVDTGDSRLAANGGGGGEGTDLSSSGVVGQNGKPNGNVAFGGDDPSCGSYGGNGSAGAELDGASAGPVDSCGGGGGGGGAGYILIHSPQHIGASSIISPAAIVTAPVLLAR